MKRKSFVNIVTFFVIAFVCTASSYAEISDPPEVIGCGRAHTHDASRLSLDGLPDDFRNISADSTHDYDALHLDIEITPDIDARTFAGITTMTSISKVNGLSEITFNLKLSVISSLTLDGETATYVHEGDFVTVTASTPISMDSTFTIEVHYDGGIYTPGAEGGILYSNADDLFTTNEPYECRRWVACYDWPFDKVTSRISVILPSQYLVLSNGVLESETDLGGGLKETIWDNTDLVATYLLSFAAHPYTIIEDDPAGENDTEISYWVFPTWVEDATFDFSRTGEMLEYFEELFGVYPFNKYHQAMTYLFGGWGAMENQTCTTYGANLIQGDRRYEHIVAHELGHQWWGDNVSPLTFANIWLNEGFASYSEVLWGEYISDEMRRHRLERFYDSAMNQDAEWRYPIYDPPYDPENGIDEMFSSTIYKKGAWVLHMLRWVVGDENFFDGLRLYQASHEFGNSVVAEFEADMEEASGMDLTAFFSEWIYQAGHPNYIFTNMRTESDSQGGYNAYVTVTQAQSNAPLFTTPIPLQFSDGTNSIIARVEMEASVIQEVSVTGLTFDPTDMVFDPDYWIFCTSQYTGIGEEVDQTVSNFELSTIWPNPFNSSTSITVQLSGRSQVTIEVYDLLGRRVEVLANGVMQAGEHRLNWKPAMDLSSGTYIIRASSNGIQHVKRVSLIK
jgi:aminopeptidase N